MASGFGAVISGPAGWVVEHAGMPGVWQILSLPQTRSPGHDAVSQVSVHGATAAPS
jgi:hypothetical protein